MIKQTDYLIIGLSAAGLHAAQTVRQLNPLCSIIAVDAQSIIYNKCFFSLFSSRYKQLDEIQLRTDKWFSKNHIEKYHATISSLDPVKQIAVDTNYTQYQYTKLLLALGSQPRTFNINHPRIFNYHTIQDAIHLQKILIEQKPKTALIIGGGLNGIEMAHVLYKYGVQVTLLEQSPNLLTNNLSPKSQEWIIRYASQRMNIHFNTRIEKIQVSQDQVIACAADAAYKANILIDCRGTVPNTQWLPAKIECDNKGYIHVNEQQQTSISNIYAAGDCSLYQNAQHSSQLWTDAALQGIHAAYAMLEISHAKPLLTIGGETKFPDFPIYWRGIYQPDYQSIIEKTYDSYREIWLDKAQKLRGFVLIGTLNGAGELTQQFLRD